MIVPTLARMLIREHHYKPINGKVLTLGRQTIGMTFEQLLELLRQENFSVSEQTLEDLKVKHDSQTRLGKGTNLISDELFFYLLGIKSINAMDVSSYEGADIVHNLNEPIPATLEGQFDFIIDGGTFDHLLDLRTAFKNVVKLLKVGGRIFQWNAASNFTGVAYLSLGPDLFYDYYSLNKFVDCKVYVAAVDDCGQKELWDLYEFEGNKGNALFRSKRILMTIVMAEKGPDSTHDSIPIQAQYRDAHLLQTYKLRQDIIARSKRKPYQGTKVGMGPPKTCVHAILNCSPMDTLAKKYKEKGFAWVFGKCLSRFKKYFNKDIVGFRYLGKI